MKVLDAIKKRRSIRKFKDKEIEESKLRKILNAARWAPSSGNNQPWKFILIKDQTQKEQIAEYAKYGAFLPEAPVLVAFLTDPEKSHLDRVDGSLASQNFQLAAWALGIGTCWIGTMNREKVKELLNIPQDKHLLTVMPLGYPAEKSDSSRKPLKNIVYAKKYGNKWK